MGKVLHKISNIIKWILIAFLGSSILAVVLFKYVQVPVSPLMFIRCFQQVKSGEQIKLKHHWVPLDSISPYLPLAVWASEDQNFMNHNGFDFTQIEKAIKERKAGERSRGASTISQQTAKNVFLWPTSSWLRKGFEVYFTILIEVIWDKHHIMEVYLNTIEMGDGIYGAEAVAREHFGCSAKELTRNQCALIAASLPNPLQYNSGAPSRYMYKRQTWILRQMRWLGSFPKREEKSGSSDI
ncbi:MAG: monofunctional biosynthetic peptidoglycan transglycosylase [Bacteroides sp.]|nr:monofunctional biosynthetic peptidoglycan transglycosylase [Roseburia sp.]MCM1345994.1 monofunctional biosynthetic peptidoglycan transglycosylase [Bacteroides sp.]MCM1420847.1 monofunctional biosynthetic peptidoglycan transglycosylase [Bacteroides sp.]